MAYLNAGQQRRAPMAALAGMRVKKLSGRYHAERNMRAEQGAMLLGAGHATRMTASMAFLSLPVASMRKRAAKYLWAVTCSVKKPDIMERHRRGEMPHTRKKSAGGPIESNDALLACVTADEAFIAGTTRSKFRLRHQLI